MRCELRGTAAAASGVAKPILDVAVEPRMYALALNNGNPFDALTGCSHAYTGAVRRIPGQTGHPAR
ncbi:hypothetical protein PSAC2689_120176 [Paraburkholderia sacchari]